MTLGAGYPAVKTQTSTATVRASPPLWCKRPASRIPSFSLRNSGIASYGAIEIELFRVKLPRNTLLRGCAAFGLRVGRRQCGNNTRLQRRAAFPITPGKRRYRRLTFSPFSRLRIGRSDSAEE